MLAIYNSLKKQKETFKPIDPENVRLYVCGMTVYDFCHIGHARVLVVFDVVYRYLCQIYGTENVTYVRNVTDIDDKIIQRANENKEEFTQLTTRFIDAMHEDSEALNVLPPNQEPCATAFMKEIIEMIEALIKNGKAYAADNGDVYYAIDSFDNYGQLSGKKLEDLRAGERVEIDKSKKDPLDFVLWKSAKPEEPSWESPWGNGRPGWHIECSAMSTHCLGNHFDIHGGGMDLQFPHHENEIAQSEGATGEKFVNVWMHNGFVRIDEEKMSKSLGNFFTIREVVKQFSPEIIRYFILTSQYRSPLNYSETNLNNAKAALTTLYTALKGMEQVKAEQINNAVTDNFYKAMDDDFNTPEALSSLFELAKEINRCRASDTQKASDAAANLKHLADQLGLLQQTPDEFLKAGQSDGSGLNDEQIDKMIQQRNEARDNKEWAESDRIRDELKSQGIILEDAAGQTGWRRE